MQKGDADNACIEKAEEGLLRWRIVNEFNALLDISFQARLARFQKLFFVGADVAEDVGCLLRARGLKLISPRPDQKKIRRKLTPSSTGTEK